MAYNKLIDLNLLSNFLSKIKSLIPTKTSDLENDSEYITGMEILSYGNSTWNDFLTAYTAKKVVYCRASSNSNPASGSQTRLAFMAYVNNADNPTNVEFQYYRSVSSHTSTQQGDQVFVYKLDKTSGWSVTTREASSKIAAGTNMTSSYSSGTLTLNASIPSNVSDLTNDSGYITGITSSDVTTALGYTPSSTDTTYSAGNGIDITNTIIKNTQGIEYIVGTQTAATAVWTGNSTDEALYTGKIIAYYLPYAGTSTAATLTLTMRNGATTEAIPLRRVGSSTVTTQFAAGNIIVLIYDGTYWRVSAYHNSSDTNTIPTGYCTTGASTAAKSANCTYGYRDDTNYFPCLFRYANTATNATLAIASYATTALPIYVNGERTSATNTFGAGVILFLYYDGAYYCYNDGRLPILVDGVVTSVQDYTNELKNTISEISQVITSTNIDSTPIATFDSSAAGMPLKGLTVNIEPVQNLNGYDHPWPEGGGKNLLKYPYETGTVTKNGVTFTVYNDGSIKVDTAGAAATANADLYFFSSTRSLPLSNGDYIFSSTYDGTLPSDGFYIHAKANASDASYLNISIGDEGLYTVSNGVFYTACIRVLSGRTINNVTVRPMLRLATEADATFEPYSNICPITGWTGCNVTRTGKNLFDIPSGTLKVGTINKYTGVIDTSASTSRYTENMLKIKGGANYAFQCVFSGSPQAALYMAYYDSNGMFLERVVLIPAVQAVAGAWSGVVQMRDDASYIRLCGYVGVFSNSSNQQIEEGNEITDYEPYQGTTYSITFPSEAGTVYGGTLDVTGGKMVVNKGYVEYDGSSDETWSKYGAGSASAYAMVISQSNVLYKANALTIQANYLKSTTPSSTWGNLDQFISAQNGNRFVTGIRTITTVADWTAYLAQNPLQVVYELATPIVYDLTADEITTLLGTNNIWANTGDITVTYGAYLTQIKNNINNLDKRVKIIEDDDPLFDKLIRLPDDDNFFDKGTFTGTGTYTKLSKNSFSLSGGNGTTYYSYPLHGTNRVVTGTNAQLSSRLLATDFVEIPANGVWGNTTYSLGIQFYCEANTTASNRNLELVLVCANIQNGEIVGTPEIVNNYVTNNKEYGSTILRLRGFGYAPLERYTHYAIFARSRSRASSAVATMTLKLVQSPRLLQYILYSGNVPETSLTATAAHAPNSFIINNDRLYKVLTQIQSGEEIVVGTNVTQVSILEALTSLLNNTENIPNTSSISNTGLISIKHDSTELFTIQLPLYNGGVSNGT